MALGKQGQEYLVSEEQKIGKPTTKSDLFSFGKLIENLIKKHQKQNKQIKISIPIFAIGGINPERTKECLDAGAYGVAVISDLLSAENPGLQVEKYMNVLRR